MQVGSEKQKVSLVVDTGSSWTWLTYDKCTYKYKEQILAQERHEEKIRLARGKDHKMTINQIIGRIEVKDGVAINNIMGVMNKNVPGENNDRKRTKDPVGSLW